MSFGVFFARERVKFLAWYIPFWFSKVHIIPRWEKIHRHVWAELSLILLIMTRSFQIRRNTCEPHTHTLHHSTIGLSWVDKWSGRKGRVQVVFLVSPGAVDSWPVDIIYCSFVNGVPPYHNISNMEVGVCIPYYHCLLCLCVKILCY
jgi:hypothetical protein